MSRVCVCFCLCTEYACAQCVCQSQCVCGVSTLASGTSLLSVYRHRGIWVYNKHDAMCDMNQRTQGTQRGPPRPAERGAGRPRPRADRDGPGALSFGPSLLSYMSPCDAVYA